MTAKPKRSSFPNGRYGAAKYAQALSTWKKSSTTTTTKPGHTRARNRRSSSAAATAKATPGTRKTSKSSYMGPGGNPSGSGQGQAQQAPSAPKLPPRKKPAAAKPAPKAPAKKAPAAKNPAPKAAASKAPAKRKPRTWLKDNYKPGAKGIKSSRLSKALSSLKVRDYKKKKK